MKTAIFLCDITGVMAKPWLEAGYRCILVDPQHAKPYEADGKLTKLGMVIDNPVTWRFIMEAVSDGVAFVAGFPPCTDLAVSGARWFAAKREADPAFQCKAMQVVWQCHVIAEMAGCPYMIENPVSQISSLWRKPDHFFHPYQFTGYCPEDNYSKKTCLWTGGGFVMPSPYREPALGEPDDRIHKAPPGPDRANFRSATPEGFARAVFLANAPHLKADNDNRPAEYGKSS